jgi:hypothetical protein
MTGQQPATLAASHVVTGGSAVDRFDLRAATVISEESSSEGSQNVLKPRSVLRSRRIASPFGFQLLRAAPLSRARSRALLLFVALGSVCVAGCQSYNANLGAPSAQSSGLNYLTPSAKRAGDPAFTLTVNGGGFVAGSLVQWNGSNRNTNVVDSTQLTADIAAADIANAGTFQIRVMTPGLNDGNNFSNILSFQVCSGACPQASTATSRAISAVPAADAYRPRLVPTAVCSLRPFRRSFRQRRPGLQNISRDPKARLPDASPRPFWFRLRYKAAIPMATAAPPQSARTAASSLLLPTPAISSRTMPMA